MLFILFIYKIIVLLNIKILLIITFIQYSDIIKNSIVDI